MRPSTVCGAFVLSVIVAAGSVTSTIDADLACETAREMVRLQAKPVTPPAPPQPAPSKCLKCDGTGRVLSGGGLAIIPCPLCKKGTR